MALGEYFESAKGIGVLATADASGEVDASLYAQPHFIDDRTIAFIMADLVASLLCDISGTALHDIPHLLS